MKILFKYFLRYLIFNLNFTFTVDKRMIKLYKTLFQYFSFLRIGDKEKKLKGKEVPKMLW